MRKIIFSLGCSLLCLFAFVCGCGRKHAKTGKIAAIQDLNTKEITIGCMTGIVATREAQQKLPKAVYKEYSMPIDAFTAICSQKADAVVLDRPTLEYMALAHPELAVMKEDLAVGRISVAAAKKNTDLMKQVNSFIRQYRKDGTYQKMYDRWFRSVNPDMPEIPAPEKAEETLKVGVTANNEPLCFIRNGTLAGFDSEFSMRLAAYLNRKIEFVDLPYDALVIGLQSGKIDLAVAFMDAMPEREESVLFSEYYIDAPITMLIRKELLKHKKSNKIARLQDLNAPDFTIGVMAEVLASKEAKKALPKAKYLDFVNALDCYTALSAGKVNAVVYDRPALEYAELDHKDFMVLPENIAIGHISVAADLKDTELIQKVNAFIRQYRKDGTYQKMYQRWVQTKTPVIPAIADPAKPDGTLVIGIDTTNPPMCYLENGRETGFDIEFIKRLALFLNKKTEYKVLPFDGLITALKGNKIVLAVAQMDATPERKDSVLFSEEYMDSAVGVMIRKKDYEGSPYTTFANLKGKKIGTLTGSCYELLAKPHMPEYELLSFTQLNQEVASLEEGKIDAFFTDAAVGRFLLLQRPKLTAMPLTIPCGDFAFVFSKENKKLCNEFSGEIRKMKQNGTLKKLQEKWFSLDEKKQTMPKNTATGKILRCAVYAECQPFGFIRNGQIVGYEVEIAILAANQLGYQLDFAVADPSSFISGVSTGKYDLSCGSVTITKERKESVLFSEPDYGGGIQIIVRKADAEDHSGSLYDWLRDTGRSLAESFDKTFLREGRWKLILQGLFTTIVITFFAVLFGTVFAFPLCMMCRSRRKIAVWLGERYISLIMGTPILVILMILYYVIFAKVDISGIVVAVIAFAMDFAAYSSVMLRSGIEGIPRGQTEAALALGHSPAAAFFRFVLPQAVRTILPVYRSEIISTLKATSVVGYIAIMDLTKMGDIIRSRTYEAFFPLIAIAIIYFLTAKCLTAILLVLEKRLDPEIRRNRLQKRGAK